MKSCPNARFDVPQVHLKFQNIWILESPLEILQFVGVTLCPISLETKANCS